MGIEVIPLSELQSNAPEVLGRCLESGRAIVVELPDQRLVALQPLDADYEEDSLISDLIENNAGFQELLKKSKAAARKPFLPRTEP